MFRTTKQFALLFVSLVALSSSLEADEGLDLFEKKIRPVLIKHCYECHSKEFGQAKGGLLLDSRVAIRKGGDSGAAVVPGKIAESLLLEAVRYESFEMPPKSKLPEEVLRRLYFDLIGIPPSREEAEQFYAAAQTDREKAIRDSIEILLASPHFGESWAALWLDVSRYAEDQAHIVGNNKALFFPNAYRYRDWVIEAMNTDLPYDEFLRLQLAADLATPEIPEDDIALGFIGLGPKYYRRNAPEVMADEWEDRVDVVTRGLLGLTVACARCHDHKFDPIPTEDYYALAGVFASTEMWNKPLDEKKEVEKSGHAKKPDEAIHIIRDKNVHDINVFIRGDVNTKGEIVPRRFLHILSQAEPVSFQQGSGRLELANQIASNKNPLTARVIVNRIWAAYFGNPLVGTPSNFGELGEKPTHPELLDDLAVRFMENGWSLKWLHREIVSSKTYQQSSELTPETATADPANKFLSRMNRRRLTVEQWRDALLKVSGQLDSAIGGPSIHPDQQDERRRTIYSERSRFQLNPLLAMFDFPDPNAHAAHRVETTTPLQQLFVMNNPMMIARGNDVQSRVLNESDEFSKQIEFVYQTLFSRSPDTDEIELGKAFVESTSWSQYAQVLLASNEFLILD